MIFQHTHELVISGQKTQTRRLWKPGWVLTTYWSEHIQSRKAVPAVYDDKAQRVVYYIGQQLAVQPGRGKPAIARIEVLRLWREDVRDTSYADIDQEGYEDNYLGWWRLWASMHDKQALPKMETLNHGALSTVMYMKTRPAERYDALAIEFRMLEGGAP